MKTLRYILYTLCMTLLASCSEDVIDVPSISSEDGLTLTCRLNIPDIIGNNTRAFSEYPDLSNLNLIVYEYEWGDSYSARFLHKIHYGEDFKANTQTGIVEFTLKTLECTDQHRVLHFIAYPKTATPPEISGYNDAASIIPRLYGTNRTDLYSQRVEFKNGYATYLGQSDDKKDRWEINDDIKKFQKDPIPMLRNFAKISITNNASNFDLDGFAVINVPQAGTAEPWDTEKMEVPEFRDASAADGLKDYDVLTKDGYKGYMPIANLTNTNVSLLNYDDPGAKFMYERPYSTANRTYVIVKGKYNGEVATYYKLDIGNENEKTGMFEPFNILRNFEYKITINSVKTKGAATPEDAASGIVYNNQIASVEAQKMLSISDGKDFISASAVNYVFVNDNETATIELSYIQNYGKSTEKNISDQLQFQLSNGDVVKKYESEVKTDASGNKTVKLTIEANNPTSKTLTQSIVAYVPGGLSRTINLILTQKFDVSGCIVYRGAWDLKPDDPDDSNYISTPNEVSNASGQGMTLYFDLPDGLPESIFPLVFQVESRQQELENDKGLGTMVVHSGESLFKDEGVNDHTISYMRTVTFDEYKYIPLENGDAKDNEFHTVMLRFSTIKAVSGEQTSTIRVVNPYFNTKDITFTRKAISSTSNS